VTAPEAKSGPVLSPREAAQHLLVAEATLAKMRCWDGGPEYLKFGQKVVYELAALDAWRNERRARNTSDAARLPRAMAQEPCGARFATYAPGDLDDGAEARIGAPQRSFSDAARLRDHPADQCEAAVSVVAGRRLIPDSERQRLLEGDFTMSPIRKSRFPKRRVAAARNEAIPP
jgi:hypothetical protein